MAASFVSSRSRALLRLIFDQVDREDQESEDRGHDQKGSGDPSTPAPAPDASSPDALDEGIDSALRLVLLLIAHGRASRWSGGPDLASRSGRARRRMRKKLDGRRWEGVAGMDLPIDCAGVKRSTQGVRGEWSSGTRQASA